MSSILTKLKAGIAARKEVVWPGSDVLVILRVLTEADYQSAGMAADRYYREAGVKVDLSNIEERSAYVHTRLLHAAIVDTDGKPLIKEYADFSAILTPEAREILIAELNGWQEENSPRFTTMTEDEFSDLYETVKKNPETVWTITGTNTLRRLASALVSQPLSVPTGS